MSITETVLVFVGIPALVVLGIYAMVYGTSARRVSKRYRPGRPFTFAPVWFLAASGTGSAAGSHAPALDAADHGKALPPGPVLAQSDDRSGPPGEARGPEWSAAPAPAHGETGGASDRW